MQSRTSPIKQLPIIGDYGVQRFRQWSPEDSANWYVVTDEGGKRPSAMYPTMGRAHISYLGINRLIFSNEPRMLAHTIDFWYAVDGNTVWRIDRFYNQVNISQSNLLTTDGNIYFDYLIVNSITFAVFVDNEAIYVYQEGSGVFARVTDPNAPGNFTVNGVPTKPGFIATFGNRIAVSVANSSQFVLSVINLLNNSGVFDPATCFTVASAQVFAQESGIIRQMGVLNNTLFIFTDFTTGVWANIPSIFSGTGVTFPWKKNTSYEWNFGIADPQSLSISFDRLCFLGRNSEGLLQVMSSSGGEPERISSKAIDTLFQRYANNPPGSRPFQEGEADGFMYQYENTIFYRLSAGKYNDFGVLDLQNSANSIEYNFESQEWHRCIETNGERNRIQKHVFFDNQHFVSVSGEDTVYQMSGNFYTNELRNALQDDEQEDDSYIAYPFRYERVTPIICEDDYSEFQTDFVQIDFVFGESNISQADIPFPNTQYLIAEDSDPANPTMLIAEDSDPVEPTYLIAEAGDTPELNSSWYTDIFKPHIELYFSDDGGITYTYADVREFSQMGQYSWRMRWYQLGCSRNRVYKLIAVSPVPIVILGGIMLTKRVSGGAY